MRGHIKTRRLPDGSPRYDIVFDAPRGGDGRRQQITRTFKSRRDAERTLNQLLRSVDTHAFHASRVTVGEYLDQWLNGKARIRETTKRSYEFHIQLYLRPHLGSIRLTDLRPQHIEAMYRAIRDGNAKRERPVGPSTMKRIHATLMSALNLAEKREMIPRNPARSVELEAVVRVERPYWLAHELVEFLEQIADDPLMPMLHLIAFRGLRRGEAVGLRWVDVDLDKAYIKVTQQIVQMGRVQKVTPPKSQQSKRTVSLDSWTVSVLRRHKRTQAAQRLASGVGWTDEGYVFARADGRPYRPLYITRRFTVLVETTGLRKIRLHDLRHTSATLGLAAGESLKEVSARLGHSTIAITADIYSHVTPAMAEASADKLGHLMESARADSAKENNAGS